jgi:uncharacterized protein DUF6114
MPRSAFWRWRHARPFWGGLFVLLAGIWIFLTEKAPLPVIVHVGMQGFIGYLVPIVLALCGVLLIVNPAQRLFYSLLAALLSLASWLTSNLGGFVLGLLLGLIGSALAFAWSPDKLRRPRAAPADADAALGASATEAATLDAAGPEAAAYGAPGPDATAFGTAGPEAAASGTAGPSAAAFGTPGPDAGGQSAAERGVGEAVTVPADRQAKPLGPPGVQPETSHRRPRHRRPSPGSDSGE